ASAAAQEFYALLAKTEDADGALGALENLVVDGLDLDQIWQEIDNQQKPLEKILKKKMKFLEKVNAADGIQLLPDAEAGEASDARREFTDTCLSTASEDEEDVDMASEASSALASDQEDEEGEEEQEPAEGGEKGPKSSAVDEGLFKLSDMNDFLEMEDKKDAEIAARHKAGKKAGDEEEDDEDEDWGEDDEFMDLEKPIGDDDSEDVYVDKLMYSDFFDAPEEGEEVAAVKPRDGEVEGSSDDDEEEDEEEEAEGGLGLPEGENLDDEEEAALEQQLKEMQGDLGEEEEEEESEDEAEQAEASTGEEKEEGGPSVAEDSRRSETSALKKRIADMENEIEEMEREQLDEKHWTMTGEATGSSRPLNSLLEQHIDLPFSKLAARRAEKQWEEGEEDEDELTQAAPGAFKIDVDAIIRQR
ncbi:u3 small nucleolar ribonucleoprotein MPP10, partial [Perkinsus olseni]